MTEKPSSVTLCLSLPSQGQNQQASLRDAIVLWLEGEKKNSSLCQKAERKVLKMKLHGSWLTVLFIQTMSALSKTANVEYSAVVNTTAGPIRGITLHLHTNKTATKFLGIPYAQADRFEPPKPPKQWNEALNATSFGNACPQMQNLDVNASQTSEDCLFINIFVPGTNTSAKLRAVMVWVHGGGFLLGSGGLPKYDGSFMATEGDVVVVTFNYRLGLLGFLWAAGISGNLGMLDQLQALTWVKENIKRYRVD